MSLLQSTGDDGQSCEMNVHFGLTTTTTNRREKAEGVWVTLVVVEEGLISITVLVSSHLFKGLSVLLVGMA